MKLPPFDGGFTGRTHFCVGLIVLLALIAGALIGFSYLFW